MIDPLAILDPVRHSDHRVPPFRIYGYRGDTDGWAAVFVRAGWLALFGLPTTTPAGSVRHVEQVFQRDLPLVPLDWAAFRAWLLPLMPAAEPELPKAEPKRVTCPNCKGTGSVFVGCWACSNTHEHRCAECLGRKTVEAPKPPEPPPPRPPVVKLLGDYFDARWMARALANLPGDTAAWGKEGDLAPLVVQGDGWRYVVMPLRRFDEPVLGEWPVTP